MAKQTPQKEMSIADYKVAMSKQSKKYQLIFTAVAFTIIGTVSGFFLSVNLISDAQAKVSNSIQVSLKDEK